MTFDISAIPQPGLENHGVDFIPIIRSGAWADIGNFRSQMEDVYICSDNFMSDYGLKNAIDGPNSFYGVFDGHEGKHAAKFARDHLPRFIAKDEGFPMEVERVVASAFLQTDSAFAKACFQNAALASGTTALAALVVGRLLVVANAGDCRAVLCCAGKAIDMSNDHKPACDRERERVVASGGYIVASGGRNDVEYLNGQVSVTRALGDWHIEGLKGGNGSDGGPLIADPELMTRQLTEEDEFLIIGSDGIWDVFRSQNAVDFTRRRLQEHNDPVKCSKELVDEALKRKSLDNLAVIVVCFQSKPPRNLFAPRPRVPRSMSVRGWGGVAELLE
ncbi:hypothetical protein SADUNF_Sadunf18G0025800 [Salix dunnii]|uniref:protein-serine/threonine phosphatase n=1 Tax=Salix dunnii TaxID=1413687 RepID=A0A835J297_9ROSI|nr:hypothetical protein SADUNF_Sadunf18G0025800 [Salix dunnii]